MKKQKTKGGFTIKFLYFFTIIYAVVGFLSLASLTVFIVAEKVGHNISGFWLYGFIMIVNTVIANAALFLSVNLVFGSLRKSIFCIHPKTKVQILEQEKYIENKIERLEKSISPPHPIYEEGVELSGKLLFSSSIACIIVGIISYLIITSVYILNVFFM